jgi:hypothetical protein
MMMIIMIIMMMIIMMMIIMMMCRDYDTRSQVLDQCVASANAAYPSTAVGLQQYLDQGAPPEKLVLGVPW